MATWNDTYIRYPLNEHAPPSMRVAGGLGQFEFRLAGSPQARQPLMSPLGLKFMIPGAADMKAAIDALPEWLRFRLENVLVGSRG